MKTSWVLPAFVALALSCPLRAEPHEDFLVVGHRGAPWIHAENTLPSVRAAVEAGADAVEVDLAMTADGEVVLWHDACPGSLISKARNLKLEKAGKWRTWLPNLGSENRRPVHELDLETFRASHGYTTDGGFKAIIGKSKRAPYEIPTFGEFLEYAASEPRLRYFFLDVKVYSDESCDQPAELPRTFAARCRELLAAHGLFDRAVFMATSRQTLETLQQTMTGTGAHFTWDQEVRPGIPKASNYSAVLPAMEVGADFASIGKPIALRAWSTYRKIIRKDLERLGERAAFDEAHGEVRSSISLIAWTINRTKELKTLHEMGVRGILTDYPGRLAVITGR